VRAKLSSLASEFEFVREKSSDIPFWNDLLWRYDQKTLQDWIMLDAWYRSRCLELPRSGVCMVPYLDMINHSQDPTAWYDETDRDEVVLQLWRGVTVAKGEEVTISYGTNKSAAEMLFSYGFLESDEKSGSIILPFETFQDDPLSKAKLTVFGEPPKVHVLLDKQGVAKWECPFAYLSCVNEEDGLDFRVLQDVEGNRELRVFWHREDVTARTKDFEAVIREHQIFPVVKLRAVSILQSSLQDQLKQLQLHADHDAVGVRVECKAGAAALRDLERAILAQSVEAMEIEVRPNTKSYLRSTNHSREKR
jgi:hypothetical protein